jgi:hypothetical protein
MCHFSQCVVLKGNRHVIRNNIDINKVKAKARVQHFYFKYSKKVILQFGLYMLLKDVMQVFLLLIPQIFIDQFVFIWGCEQCARTFGQLIT